MERATGRAKATQGDPRKCRGATTPTFCATTPSCPNATSSCCEALRALLRARAETGSAPAHPGPPQSLSPALSRHKAPPQDARSQLCSPGAPQICDGAKGGNGSSTLHGGDPRAASASPALTFSLILAMLSPITRFRVSRRDFRAAAVPRRKASLLCLSALSVARCAIRARLSSPAVPLATTSACREASTDARMLR